MTYLKFDLADERVQYLMQTDEVLGKLIRYIGSSELLLEKDGFKCLVKYIIGQQISDKARETIWQRLCLTFGDVTPSIMLSKSDDELRALGLSGRKIEYIKRLAENVIQKQIDFEEFQLLSNEEIIERLTAIKGIGRWTAEMYLIFSLGREDVFSKGDGTIQRTIQWMYDLKELPSTKVLTQYFHSWTKYSTIVSSYLWKSIALGLTQKPFNEAVSETKDSRYWMNYSINISEKNSSIDLHVGIVLVSDQNEMLCSAYAGEEGNASWCSILINKIRRLNISNAQTAYLTINTLSSEHSFDVNKLLKEISIVDIYIGLPDPSLTEYCKDDPALNLNHIYRYPNDLQCKILKQNEREYLASSQSLKHSPYYSKNRISSLVLKELKFMGLDVSKEELNVNKQKEHLALLICRKHGLEYGEAATIVNNALSKAFNSKYGEYNYSDDTRSIELDWINHFIKIYEQADANPISSHSIINVGVGNGEEAIALFSDCNRVTFVDIANTGLKKIQENFPFSETIVSSAEDLSSIPDKSFDLYVSLRTYNSSFFNIREAIAEAHRVLKTNAIIIISVANGFYCPERNGIIPGLIIPGTEFVDIYRGMDTVKLINTEFLQAGFKNIRHYSTNTEIYLSAITD